MEALKNLNEGLASGLSEVLDWWTGTGWLGGLYLGLKTFLALGHDEFTRWNLIQLKASDGVATDDPMKERRSFSDLITDAKLGNYKVSTDFINQTEVKFHIFSQIQVYFIFLLSVSRFFSCLAPNKFFFLPFHCSVYSWLPVYFSPV